VCSNANRGLVKLVLVIVKLFGCMPGLYYSVQQEHWPEEVAAQMTVLDLGAGAAIHIRAGNTNWLFDCGSDRSYEHVVREYLHWAGVNQLSGLFLTHGDSLHIGGAMQLLDDFPNVHVFDNPAPDRSALHRRLSRMLSELKKRGL